MLRSGRSEEALIQELQFAGEEAASERGYPPGYRARSLDDQVLRLAQAFPRLAIGPGLPAPGILPSGAEAWFVIPDWRKVSPTYNAAVRSVLATLADQREASLARVDRLGPDRFRQLERTADMSARLAAVAGSDLILMPAQFGLRHRGQSIRHARERCAGHEFCLGAFAVACLLLTHPERIARADQLYVDCAGDEYSASDELQFSEAPYFRFLDGKLGFGTSWFGYADPFFGSASAFL